MSTRATVGTDDRTADELRQLAEEADEDALSTAAVAGEGVRPYESDPQKRKKSTQFHEHNKESLEIQAVILTLGEAEREAGLALVTSQKVAENKIIRHWLADKPDDVAVLNKTQVILDNFLTYIRLYHIELMLKLHPHLEFVLKTINECSEYERQKAVEAHNKKNAEPAAAAAASDDVPPLVPQEKKETS